MEWTSEGILLGTRPHGETSLILEVMTPANGRHLGLVRGGRSRRQQAVLQPGNTLLLSWRARLDGHLGHFTAEPVVSRAARLMDSATGVLSTQVLAAHLRFLPERDPHPALYAALELILDHLDEPVGAARMIVRFELALLDELGFGLDLSACAATGVSDDLAYVSPKSGRAVSRAAGAPWAGRLLPLPAFLANSELVPAPDDLRDALALTGFFLARRVAEPRGETLAPARAQLIARLPAGQAAPAGDAGRDDAAEDLTRLP